jgi:hypothetical protein
MVTQEGVPALHRHALAWSSVETRGHILADRARRDLQAEFEPQFVGDAPLAPGEVLTRHLADESLQLRWDRRPSRTRRPWSEQLESLAPPPRERFRLHHHESPVPVKPPRQPEQGDPGGMTGLSWLDVVFLVKAQLFAQKEVFCGKRHRRTWGKSKESRGIDEQCNQHEHTLIQMTDRT